MSPILFLVFNRPEKTQKVFQQIKEARPSKLYVAADGPRKIKANEKEKCDEVRSIATNVDWDCEVKTLFRQHNLGCKQAVSQAIDWLFKNEEMGIILEDDCLPDSSFFKFCEELLYKYKDDERVMSIYGCNFQQKRSTMNSYYFSKHIFFTGWATWKNSWKSFDFQMKEWPSLKRKNFLSKVFPSKRIQKYWEDIFDRTYHNKIDSWGHVWQYSIWKEDGIAISPEVNLVKHIGYGEDGTHTKNTHDRRAKMTISRLYFPLKHPENIKVNTKADDYTQKFYFQPTLLMRILWKVKRIIKTTLYRNSD